MKFPNPFYAIGALYRAVKGLFSVKPSIVSEEISGERLKTCENCPFYLAEYQQCDVCTCFIPLKILLSTERCPKGFWLDVKP